MPKIKATEQLQMGIYNFHPRWTTNYSVSIQDRIMEMEDVLKTGYFNSIIVEVPYLNLDEFWRLMIEYDCSVWLNIYDFNNSKKRNVKTETTFDEWVKIYDDELDILKSHPERWERFCGIHYDEPIWRGQSNSDFLECSKHFHDKYSLRNFVVCATGEFMGFEANDILIHMDAKDMQKINPASFKYVTDIAFDAYCVDMREGTDYSRNVAGWKERISEKVENGTDYYRYILHRLLEYIGHEMNVWYFPTSYITYLACGLNGIQYSDEGYCMGHLLGMEKLLSEFEHPAGLCLYTYYGEKGLQNFLEVKYEDGTQKLLPEKEKWPEYSRLLIEMTKRFRQTKVNPILAKDIKD